MILSGKSIKRLIDAKKIIIEPFNEKHIRPCSYDVTLSGKFGYYFGDYYDVEYDCDEYVEKYKFKNGDRILVLPGWWEYNKECFEGCDIKHIFYGGVLGLTNEWIKLPNDICAQYQGRSSLARLFLTSHQTAGWIDAGFEGRIVLEIVAHDMPVILTVGKRIGQLIFFMLDSDCGLGYCDLDESKYKYQSDVIGFKKDNF